MRTLEYNNTRLSTSPKNWDHFYHNNQISMASQPLNIMSNLVWTIAFLMKVSFSTQKTTTDGANFQWNKQKIFQSTCVPFLSGSGKIVIQPNRNWHQIPFYRQRPFLYNSKPLFFKAKPLTLDTTSVTRCTWSLLKWTLSQMEGEETVDRTIDRFACRQWFIYVRLGVRSWEWLLISPLLLFNSRCALAHR